jgi:exodeoxyribonuclease VII small subunit
MDTEIETLTFEAALQELETIVARLEAGNLTLDESLALFERGQKLAHRCDTQLNEASLRVEQLTADGEIVELPSP